MSLQTNQDITPSYPFLSREVIEKEYASKIKITDTDEKHGLDVFCYDGCNNSDSLIVKQSRGLVFHGNELISVSFPYADEYNHTETDSIREIFATTSICENLADCAIFESYEGTVIRMFYYSGKWFITTNKKLNAFTSFWSSRESFGGLFRVALQKERQRSLDFKNFLNRALEDNEEKEYKEKDILETFQNLLNKDNQYFFLLRNTQDNRIVCEAPTEQEPSVYHIGTRTKNNTIFPMMYKDDSYVWLPLPKLLHFNNIKNLLEHVNSLDYKKSQGVVCFNTSKKSFQAVKILNKTYQDFFNVRNNEASVNFRYLQIRKDKEKTALLKQLYPTFTANFEKYEQILEGIAKRLYGSYVDRYIKKTFVSLPVEEFIVNNTCHKAYLETGKRVSLETIKDVLNNQDPSSLNKMIKNVLYKK
jgi:hypothetical protein